MPSAKNDKMSNLLAVVVIVGAVAAGHLTPVKVPVKLPAPVLSSSVNDLPAVAVGIVNVQLPVSVQVWVEIPYADSAGECRRNGQSLQPRTAMAG